VAQDKGWDWAAAFVRRVGAAMKNARGRRTAKWLSDRTAELGWRISPTVIAKLDSGHRAALLTVPELLVLAAALQVPPAVLLFPDLPDGKVRVLPDMSVTSWAAVEWLAGERNLPGLESYPSANEAELMRAVRERQVLLDTLTGVEHLHAVLAREGRDVKLAGLQQLESIRSDIKRLNALIHSLGGRLDELRSELAELQQYEIGPD
jgi:hypothetical protein